MSAGHVYNGWKTPAKQAFQWISDEKETEVNHIKETSSEETMTQLGKMSISRYLTEMNGKNGLPDVLVSHWVD